MSWNWFILLVAGVDLRHRPLGYERAEPWLVESTARVAFKRVVEKPQEGVLGVEWELVLIFGFTAQRICPHQPRLRGSAGGRTVGSMDRRPEIGPALEDASTAASTC